MAQTTTKKLFELLSELPSWYKDMLLGIHTDNMAISTKCGYCRDVRSFFEWLKESNPQYKDKAIKDFTLADIEKLTPADANEFATYLSGYSASTMSRRLAAVSSMYVELMRFNKVEKNPFAVVRRPKQKKNVIIYLTDKEMEDLFREIMSGSGLTDKELSYHNPTRDIALFSLFLDTGMRISEVAGLNIKDVDFDECYLIAKRKGGKHEMIYFSDSTCKKMQDYLEIRKANVNADPEPFFINSRGTRLSIQSIQILTERYASIAIPNKHISPHKLRSTFAMNFYSKTKDLLLLKEKMGHANIQTTNIYAEAEKSRMRDTRNLLF